MIIMSSSPPPSPPPHTYTHDFFVEWLSSYRIQGIADVVETLLEDVDSYLDEASGKGANQQVLLMFVYI